MNGYEQYYTTVVRLFPDYAGTPLWFSEPVAYDSAYLSSDLEEALRNWEKSYYEALTSDIEWRSPDLETAFLTEGHRLAEWLARELGGEFQVECDDLDGSGKRRFQSPNEATNPKARDAFAGMASRSIAEQQELRHRKEEAERHGRQARLAVYPPGAVGRRPADHPDC